MKHQSACSLSLRMVFWTAGMLALATGAGRPAQASPVHFQINNNGGLIEPLSQTLASIAGQFNYDPATDIISNFEVTLTTHLQFAGTYTDVGSPILIPVLGQPRIVFGGEGDHGLFYAINLYLNDFGVDGGYDIRFITALGTPNPDYTLVPADAQSRPNITIKVGGEAAVPEPSTRVSALSGGALMLLALLRRRVSTSGGLR